jgi:hypothetical protein
MSYLYVKWNSFSLRFTRRRLRHYSMFWVSLATPGTKACDAVGGAFRPQWREWPGRNEGIVWATPAHLVNGSRLHRELLLRPRGWS